MNGKSDINKMQKRAMEIRNKYEEIEPKSWGVEQVFMGMVKDVGDLSKLLMVKGGYRNDFSEDAREKLEHEVIDVFWSSMVLAKKLDVNLEEKFYQVMDELEEKIANK